MTGNDSPSVLCRDVLTLCNGYGCSLLNNCAYVCMLEAGHDGPHRDEFEHEGRSVVVTWCTDNEEELKCQSVST